MTLLLALSLLITPQTADSIQPHEVFTIDSRVMAETRTVNVYLPPQYRTDTRKKFFVLYMPDGAIDEDFPHVAHAIDSLIRLKKIPPMLVVGIANTERRRDMTGPTSVASDSTIATHVGGSAAFRSFIKDELMPEVRRRYRTTGETAVVGESLAGLFIVETFLLEPNLFDRYIALSPSLFWNNAVNVRTAKARLAAFDRRKRVLFLAAANEPGIEKETADLAAILKARPPKGLTWYYEPRPDLRHNTIYLGVSPEAFVKVLK